LRKREPQIAGSGEFACLHGTLNDRLKQILVEGRVAGCDGSDAGGV
jgi:hypothetical protein